MTKHEQQSIIEDNRVIKAVEEMEDIESTSLWEITEDLFEIFTEGEIE